METVKFLWWYNRHTPPPSLPPPHTRHICLSRIWLVYPSQKIWDLIHCHFNRTHTQQKQDPKWYKKGHRAEIIENAFFFLFLNSSVAIAGCCFVQKSSERRIVLRKKKIEKTRVDYDDRRTIQVSQPTSRRHTETRLLRNNNSFHTYIESYVPLWWPQLSRPPSPSLLPGMKYLFAFLFSLSLSFIRYHFLIRIWFLLCVRRPRCHDDGRSSLPSVLFYFPKKKKKYQIKLQK